MINFAGPGDSFCVIRLDRLGRSLKELLETVEDLKSQGINLISLEEKLDTSSAAGELVFHVFGAIAHFERRLISERTRDSIAAARKRGKNPGCPKLGTETVSALHKLVKAGMTPGMADQRLTELSKTQAERSRHYLPSNGLFVQMMGRAIIPVYIVSIL